LKLKKGDKVMVKDAFLHGGDPFRTPNVTPKDVLTVRGVPTPDIIFLKNEQTGESFLLPPFVLEKIEHASKE